MNENIADQLDLASKHEELFLELAMKNKKPEGPKATGFCLLSGCGEELPEGRRWCDAEHREMWELDQRRGR